METKEELLKKVAELQAIIKKIDSVEPNKFLLDQINGSVQSWKDGSDGIYWKKDGLNLMIYNRKTKKFYLHYDKIWKVLQSKFGLNHEQINELCVSILKEHFNCDVVITMYIYDYIYLLF
jgi:hypothetical protein